RAAQAGRVVSHGIPSGGADVGTPARIDAWRLEREGDRSVLRVPRAAKQVSGTEPVRRRPRQIDARKHAAHPRYRRRWSKRFLDRAVDPRNPWRRKGRLLVQRQRTAVAKA